MEKKWQIQRTQLLNTWIAAMGPPPTPVVWPLRGMDMAAIWDAYAMEAPKLDPPVYRMADLSSVPEVVHAHAFKNSTVVVNEAKKP